MLNFFKRPKKADKELTNALLDALMRFKTASVSADEIDLKDDETTEQAMLRILDDLVAAGRLSEKNAAHIRQDFDLIDRIFAEHPELQQAAWETTRSVYGDYVIPSMNDLMNEETC